MYSDFRSREVKMASNSNSESVKRKLSFSDSEDRGEKLETTPHLPVKRLKATAPLRIRKQASTPIHIHLPERNIELRFSFGEEDFNIDGINRLADDDDDAEPRVSNNISKRRVMEIEVSVKEGSEEKENGK